jgi:hypothetical protein
MRAALLYGLVGIWGLSMPAQGDDLSCISTTFRLLGANDKVCVSAFDLPDRALQQFVDFGVGREHPFGVGKEHTESRR